jgi:hypothetical protein
MVHRRRNRTTHNLVEFSAAEGYTPASVVFEPVSYHLRFIRKKHETEENGTKQEIAIITESDGRWRADIAVRVDAAGKQ